MQICLFIDLFLISIFIQSDPLRIDSRNANDHQHSFTSVHKSSLSLSSFISLQIINRFDHFKTIGADLSVVFSFFFSPLFSVNKIDKSSSITYAERLGSLDDRCFILVIFFFPSRIRSMSPMDLFALYFLSKNNSRQSQSFPLIPHPMLVPFFFSSALVFRSALK